MTLTRRQKKILKKWYYGGSDKGNYLNRYPVHQEVVDELIELGLIKMKWVGPWYMFTTPPRLSEGYYIPRLTDAGICARRELVPDTPYT